MYPVSIVGGLSSANYRLNFASGTLQVTPLAVDFSLAATPTSQIAPPGAVVTYTLQVAPVGASYDHPVVLTATGLPTNATYSFNPTTVIPGAQGSSATLTINLPRSQAKLSFVDKFTLFAGLLMLPLAALHRRRRFTSLFAIGLMAVIALGAAGYFSQPEQTYTITITGSSGALVHNATVTLTVQ